MRRLLFLLLGLFSLATTPAQARVDVAPYLEAQQVLVADLDGGDTLTYTTLAAGVDASVQTRRVEATASYRFEYRIPWDDDFSTETVHSGIARARLQVVPNLLTLEGGALASRARSDIRGAAPEILVGDQTNTSQVYGVFAGPTLATEIGPLDASLSYRFGYVKVSDRISGDLPAGQPLLDAYDSATIHQVDGSVGMPSGRLPFGWTVTAGYAREDASQLDERFIAKYVRGDVTVPVSPTLALTAGAGYDDIEASQRAPLRNPDGTPVIDGNGRFVTDPGSPRLLAFDIDGLMWDVGVIWKPNRRMTAQLRGGKRYGSWAVTGSLDWQISPYSGLQVGIYNGIESFGRSLIGNVAGLPASFDLARNPFQLNPGGCVTGSNPGTGGCFDDTFQSIATSNFRSRGIFGIYSTRHGPWRASLGAGYAQRKFLAPADIFFSINGVTDESVMVQANVARELSRRSGIDGTVFTNWYMSGIQGAPDVTSTGATATYYHNFTNRLTGNASAGIYSFHQDGFDSDVIGTLLLGLRYQF